MKQTNNNDLKLILLNKLLCNYEHVMINKSLSSRHTISFRYCLPTSSQSLVFSLFQDSFSSYEYLLYTLHRISSSDF